MCREPDCREVGRKKSHVAPGMLRLRSRCVELSVSVTHQPTFRIDSNADSFCTFKDLLVY